jgi:hypothetical protein
MKVYKDNNIIKNKIIKYYNNEHNEKWKIKHCEQATNITKRITTNIINTTESPFEDVNKDAFVPSHF